MSTQEPDPRGDPLREYSDPAYKPLCATLHEVREEINRLDEEIVRLIATRAMYVKDAIRFKRDSFQVSAPARQADVFDRVRTLVQIHDRGFANLEQVVDATYRAMVTAFISNAQTYFDMTIEKSSGNVSPMTPMMTESNIYLLERSAREDERLRKQAQDLASEARWLLDRLEIPPNARAIELGCGPQGVLGLLSERVGPSGTVVGLDKNEGFVAAARKSMAEQQLTNVEIMQGDARATGLPRESFDIVFCRLLLVNVPQPEQLVEEMVALLRQGGFLASHEADYLPHGCDPPCPAWERLFEIFQAYSRAKGVDLFVGRRTHRMLREAGLVELQVNPVIHVYPHGHNRRNIFLDFVLNIRDSLVREGFATDEELNELTRDLKRHLDAPDTLVVSHLFFQVWGRKLDPRGHGSSGPINQWPGESADSSK
jgi:SAM-dependent methyltransferase/chorismate mutase